MYSKALLALAEGPVLAVPSVANACQCKVHHHKVHRVHRVAAVSHYRGYYHHAAYEPYYDGYRDYEGYGAYPIYSPRYSYVVVTSRPRYRSYYGGLRGYGYYGGRPYGHLSYYGGYRGRRDGYRFSGREGGYHEGRHGRDRD